MSSQTLNVDVAVVGGGLAGLTAALAVADSGRASSVAVLLKGSLGASGSSSLAQGGIAAAVGENDSADLHAADTERVARGIADGEVIRILTQEGPAQIERLLDWGARFDRTRGNLALGREGGHHRRRVLHANGDKTGAELMRVLKQRVLEHPLIRVEEDFFAVDLIRETTLSASPVRGLVGFRESGSVRVFSRATVLATGGMGQLFRYTTNPPEVTGDGVAMAARAGAELVDLEFVQFHPTALAAAGAEGRLMLLTEALRGEGALLVDRNGRRFMPQIHADGELAPRDVVARTLFRRQLSGVDSFLDLRPVSASTGAPLAERFPTAAASCRKNGLDPARDLVPVSPAAHYTMGGVWVDAFGRTSLPGLWACGEVTSSGAHGANRLASNSLLEALVFGRRVADDLARAMATAPASRDWASLPASMEARPQVLSGGRFEDPVLRSELQDLMWSYAGLIREESGLRAALERLAVVEASCAGRPGELGNMVLCARLVASAALLRRESRGAHFRADHPDSLPAWRRRQRFDATTLMSRVNLPERGAQEPLSAAGG